MDVCTSEIRKQLDEIDKSILILLGIRHQLSIEMAEVKKEKNIDVVQLSVWKGQMERRMKENEKIHLSPDFVNQLFGLIHKESVKVQEEIVNQK